MIVEFNVVRNTATPMLKSLAARSADMKPAFAVVVEAMRAGFRENWSSRGSDFGTPWAPNKPGTLANKAREGQQGLLTATGALETAIRGGKGATRRVALTSARAGVSGRSLFYARFLQSGRTDMPARPLVGIDVETSRRSVSILERYLLRGT